jgi:dihydroorotate dehydrogenase (NAD+) catalytic subunit
VKRHRRRRGAAGGRGSHVDVDLGIDLGPVHLPNPVIAASGTFGHGVEVAGLCDPSQLGAVTVKSLASFPWSGNPPLRVTEAPGGGMCNSIGLAGPGVDAWVAHDLPALEARAARVIASVWGRTVDDYAAAAAPLKRVADRIVAVEVNLSCPNVEARQAVFAHNPQATADAIRAVVEALGGAVPVFAKLSPNVTDLCEIAHAAVDAGATGLTLINTVMALVVDVETRHPRLGAGGGGLSGPPIRPVALRAVWEVSRSLPGVPIIGTGGVSSGSDAVEMLLAGATAVGVGTASFADPRAPVRILDELRTWCADRRVGHVKDLVGALEDQA